MDRCYGAVKYHCGRARATVRWVISIHFKIVHNILAKRQAHVLAAFASSNVLVAFDYDGTLAPIAPRPDAVKMRLRTRKLLSDVARRYPAVVISGRSRDDLLRHVKNVPVWHLAGNHGLEPWGTANFDKARVRKWVSSLERDLAAHAGVHVEDKIYSLTVHYRHARNRRAAVMRLRHAISRLSGARSIGGRYAISVVPTGAPNKGDALERARQLLVCDTAIYLGDDETDEDVFERASHHKLLAIRVGRSRSSRAQYCLTSQHDIDTLLDRLLTLRPLRAVRRSGA